MPEPVFRVSQVDVFRAWEEDPDADMGWLLKALASKEPTKDMLRGTAFHAALETISTGEVDRIESQGFTFLFDGDYELPLFRIREVRANKNYGRIVVSGAVDGIRGHHIMDHKAATWFDAERYFSKYAWRYYLDIFNADRFTWNIWEMKETDNPREFMVRDLHVIEQYRYPQLEHDCRELALRLRNFAAQHLVSQPPKPNTEELLAASINQARLKKAEAGLGITEDDIAHVTGSHG